jgi:nucleotide-binding universal stress UspA family protein
MSTHPAARIVVGVFPGQRDAVVEHAAAIAARYDAELVCAWVDRSRYVIDESADGVVRSMPIDPDVADTTDRGLPVRLLAQLARLLEPSGVRWSTRELAGDTARALGHLAELLGAVMVVVGAREAGVRGSLQEFFSGSTAVHLVHQQQRPVLVIPVNPVSFDDVPPWWPR